MGYSVCKSIFSPLGHPALIEDYLVSRLIAGFYFSKVVTLIDNNIFQYHLAAVPGRWKRFQNNGVFHSLNPLGKYTYYNRKRREKKNWIHRFFGNQLIINLVACVFRLIKYNIVNFFINIPLRIFLSTRRTYNIQVHLVLFVDLKFMITLTSLRWKWKLQNSHLDAVFFVDLRIFVTLF